MPTELPIACSLSATELPARLAEIAELGRDALVDVELNGTHASCASRPARRARARRGFVAAESACCAFLPCSVSDEPDTVVLDITAPEDAELVLTSSSTRSAASRRRLDEREPKPRRRRTPRCSAAAC